MCAGQPQRSATHVVNRVHLGEWKRHPSHPESTGARTSSSAVGMRLEHSCRADDTVVLGEAARRAPGRQQTGDVGGIK